MDGGTLSEVLFVLWGFPELTQTFIHREMVGMQRRGVRVNVLAGERIARDDLDEVLADIAARTLYLGPPHAWARRGLAWAARHPARFSRALGRMVAMGHRTQLHRMRAAAMLLAAASVVEDVRAVHTLRCDASPDSGRRLQHEDPPALACAAPGVGEP